MNETLLLFTTMDVPRFSGDAVLVINDIGNTRCREVSLTSDNDDSSMADSVSEIIALRASHLSGWYFQSKQLTWRNESRDRRYLHFVSNGEYQQKSHFGVPAKITSRNLK
ncbi:hypothetical protein PUN28_019348 [Cardiocondyla obscurior]|uniref:Uncharacterized protein n=1 Tax=Cardiocondyla obscurior TaxID=286306 RepID=A0AAW2EGY6_9HYME